MGRGWTHVVADDLITNAVAITCLIMEEVDGYSFTLLDRPVVTASLIGAFVGFSLSSAFLSIIEGSVSAILVCYATAPVQFHANHPKLSKEMNSAWKHYWLQKSISSDGSNSQCS